MGSISKRSLSTTAWSPVILPQDCLSGIASSIFRTTGSVIPRLLLTRSRNTMQQSERKIHLVNWGYSATASVEINRYGPQRSRGDCGTRAELLHKNHPARKRFPDQ